MVDTKFFEAMDDDGSDFENDILDDEAIDAVCNALTIESLDEEDMEEFMEPVARDELESIGPSDNEQPECYDNYADFASENALEGNIELSVGMKFANVDDEFREALREWSIHRGVEYKCKKSDRTRVRAVCKVSKDCKFLVHASLVGGENTFQIKSWNPDHTCPREAKNNLITSDYLGKKLLEDFRSNPKEPILGMRNRVNRILGYEIGLQRLYQARRKAMKINYGDHAHQFEVSRAYGEAIIKTNPGSLVRLSTEPQPHMMVDGIVKELPPRFQKMYVSFHAIIAGFIAGCRPIIGLAGCFLKTHFGGHLLSAIARDGNDNMCPIGIAAVEVKNKDSWTWFMTALLDGLQGVDPTNLVFMSDMQKGLVQTFEHLLPNTEHRFCVKHLFENYKKQFKGKQYKDLLWQAATATTENGFDIAMKKLQKIDDGKAYTYLKRLEPRCWTRSHFSFKAKTDVLVNNISESFNAYILQAREMPIISMLEWIRKKLMSRLHVKKIGMEQYYGPITPNIHKRLESLKNISRECIVVPASDRKVEVAWHEKSFSIDIREKYCSCRVWGLTGIPCVHGIATIRYWRMTPEDFVDKCFSKETYLKVYSSSINPIPDLHDYLATSSSTIAGPLIKKPPGRPKKMRQKQPGEASNPYKKVTRINKPVKCENYGVEGHNVRNCKASIIGETPSQRKARLKGEQAQHIGKPHPKRQKMATKGGKHSGTSSTPNECPQEMTD